MYWHWFFNHNMTKRTSQFHSQPENHRLFGKYFFTSLKRRNHVCLDSIMHCINICCAITNVVLIRRKHNAYYKLTVSVRRAKKRNNEEEKITDKMLIASAFFLKWVAPKWVGEYFNNFVWPWVRVLTISQEIRTTKNYWRLKLVSIYTRRLWVLFESSD